MNTTVLVEGMTCAHCVNSVTEELTSLPGVTNVSVELTKGGASPVTIESAEPLERTQISEAIAEAGYSVVGED
jgi:copper chaperone CopZ